MLVKMAVNIQWNIKPDFKTRITFNLSLIQFNRYQSLIKFELHFIQVKNSNRDLNYFDLWICLVEIYLQRRHVPNEPQFFNNC